MGRGFLESFLHLLLGLSSAMNKPHILTIFRFHHEYNPANLYHPFKISLFKR